VSMSSAIGATLLVLEFGDSPTLCSGRNTKQINHNVKTREQLP
jgi:hypothetical protein